jgi:hypothetical protein
MERIVGFFGVIADLHGSEAGVLLVWDRKRERVRFVVPEQLATISRNRWGDVWAIGLEYQVPTDLPPHWTVIGDVHSHVDGSPHPSFVDDRDENHRAGLHVIVGRIRHDPPEFRVEAVVDGTRFQLKTWDVIEDYERRRTRVPQAWIDKVRIKAYGYKPLPAERSYKPQAEVCHEKR